MRAFSVVEETGLRKTDWSTGRAKIEGSKEISGGTDPEFTYDPDNPNGPPHVDEAVQFTFDADYDVNAKSVEILLSKFSLHEVIDLGLQVNLESGITTTLSFLGTDDADIFEQVGDYNDKLWKLKFSGIDTLDDDDLIRSFEIRAIEDNPNHPSGTAEHFMIVALTASYSEAGHGGGGGNPPPVVPEPSSIMVWLLLGLSCSCVRWWQRRR